MPPGCDCGSGPGNRPFGGGAPFTAVAISAKRQRPVSVTGKTTAWEPLVLALPVSPLGNTFWLVSQIGANLIVTNPPQDAPLGPGVGPASGLFMSPLADVGESAALALQTVSFQTRAIPLDTVVVSTFIPSTSLYAVSYVWASGAGPLIVPQGWTLVAICTPHAGTVQPGPGANSQGTLTALVSDEQQTQ